MLLTNSTMDIIDCKQMVELLAGLPKSDCNMFCFIPKCLSQNSPKPEGLYANVGGDASCLEVLHCISVSAQY